MGSRGHVRESLPWCWGVEEAPCVAPSLPGASEFPRRRLGDIRSILLGGNFVGKGRCSEWNQMPLSESWKEGPEETEVQRRSPKSVLPEATQLGAGRV